MGSKAIRLKDKDGNKIYPCPYFPVGSIYISVTNTNPTTYFGGTWEAFGTGRTLVGVDTSQTEFNSVKKTGGEKTHKLTVNEMPKHSHQIYNYMYYDTGGLGYSDRNMTFCCNGNLEKTYYGTTLETGNDQAHNNLQPYITVYMWLRTA